MIPENHALVVLGALKAAFPDHPHDPGTPGLYVQAVGRLEQPDVLTDAAQRWILQRDRFPTVHQLVEAYQAEARHRADVARRQAEDRGVAQGRLPGLPAGGAEAAIEMVDVLRTALEEATTSRKHLHQRGATGCPTCTQAPAIAERMHARVAELLDARGLAADGGPQATYLCPDCLDRGFVPHSTDELGRMVVRPCSRCHEPAFNHWRAGHHGPASDCRACAA